MSPDPLPAVSVCIANYNGIGVIDACIQSVRAQTFALPIEIIIHDDASQDRSAAHIRENHPDVVLLESADNVGFCVSNNRMVEKARGQYILLLNNDAELFPDAIETLYAEATARHGPAILGLPQYDADNGELLDRGSLFDPFLNPVPNLDPERQDVGMMMGACLWIPKTLWDDLGGFPEWFHTLAEDLYLCLRAHLLGHSVRVAPGSGFFHHVGVSLGGGKVKQGRLVTQRSRRARSELNKTRAMIMCFPLPLLAMILPVHLAALAVEGVLLASVRRDIGLFRDIYWQCFRQLWSERTTLWRERARAQAGRRAGVGRFLTPFVCWPYKPKMLMRYGWPQVR